MSDEPPKGEDAVSQLQGVLPPFHLVHPDICKELPSFCKVETFLENFDVDVPMPEEAGALVANGIICRVWSTDEFKAGRSEAVELFETFGRGGLHSLPSTTDASRRSSNLPLNKVESQFGPSQRAVSNDVAKRFSHGSSNIGGHSTKCFSKCSESYAGRANELELDDNMKKTFFII